MVEEPLQPQECLTITANCDWFVDRDVFFFFFGKLTCYYHKKLLKQEITIISKITNIYVAQLFSLSLRRLFKLKEKNTTLQLPFKASFSTKSVNLLEIFPFQLNFHSFSTKV